MKLKNLKQKTKMNWRYQKYTPTFVGLPLEISSIFSFSFVKQIYIYIYIYMSSLGWLLDLLRMFRVDVRSLTYEIEFIKICYNVLNIWCHRIRGNLITSLTRRYFVERKACGRTHLKSTKNPKQSNSIFKSSEIKNLF